MPENNPSSAPYSESLLVHFCRAEQLRAEALRLPALDLNRRASSAIWKGCSIALFIL